MFFSDRFLVFFRLFKTAYIITESVVTSFLSCVISRLFYDVNLRCFNDVIYSHARSRKFRRITERLCAFQIHRERQPRGGERPERPCPTACRPRRAFGVGRDDRACLPGHACRESRGDRGVTAVPAAAQQQRRQRLGLLAACWSREDVGED